MLHVRGSVIFLNLTINFCVSHIRKIDIPYLKFTTATKIHQHQFHAALYSRRQFLSNFFAPFALYSRCCGCGCCCLCCFFYRCLQSRSHFHLLPYFHSPYTVLSYMSNNIKNANKLDFIFEDSPFWFCLHSTFNSTNPLHVPSLVLFFFSPILFFHKKIILKTNVKINNKPSNKRIEITAFANRLSYRAHYRKN